MVILIKLFFCNLFTWLSHRFNAAYNLCIMSAVLQSVYFPSLPDKLYSFFKGCFLFRVFSKHPELTTFDLFLPKHHSSSPHYSAYEIILELFGFLSIPK